MPQIYLQDVIAGVLRFADTPLTAAAIAELIARQRLWLRPSDQQPPAAKQIHARVNQYPQLFERQNDLILLKETHENEARLFRLTWNTNGWQQPVWHKWREANQGKTNIAFENQYGFGGEEWLFNPRYFLRGYQYGFIRGVQDLGAEVTQLSSAYLFTFNQETRERFLVGRISQLEIISTNTSALRIGRKLYSRYLPQMEAELLDAKADLAGLATDGLLPNVRFKVNGDELFEQLLPVPGLDGHQYKRFMPYIVNPQLKSIIAGAIPPDDFLFNPGVASSSRDFERHQTAATRTIKRLHTDMTLALEKYLAPEFSRGKKNLSIEKTKFGNNIADIVLKHGKDHITILEVKTSNIARKNIREALGQLLDYACWHSHLKIKKLVIISPCVLSAIETAHLDRIRQIIGISIAYWQYLPNSGKGEKPFLEIV
ncbi:MAG: hypothetical protein V4577_14320 [Bacteroidota bacterium]